MTWSFNDSLVDIQVVGPLRALWHCGLQCLRYGSANNVCALAVGIPLLLCVRYLCDRLWPLLLCISGSWLALPSDCLCALCCTT
jgi:hypothetical protein